MKIAQVWEEIAQELMKTAQIAKIKAPITQDSEIQLIDTKQKYPI